MSNPDVKDEAGERAMLIEWIEGEERWSRSESRRSDGQNRADALYRAEMLRSAIDALFSDAKDKRIAELEAERGDAISKALKQHGLAQTYLNAAIGWERRTEAAESQLHLTGTEDAGVRALVEFPLILECSAPDRAPWIELRCASLEHMHAVAEIVRAALTSMDRRAK